MHLPLRTLQFHNWQVQQDMEKENVLTHIHVYNTHTAYDKFSFYFLTSVNCDAIYHKTNRPLYNATWKVTKHTFPYSKMYKEHWVKKNSNNKKQKLQKQGNIFFS